MAGALLAGALSTNIAMADPEELISIHDWIKDHHPTVHHINGQQLDADLRGDQDIVLFDVREESEYAVSHLTNAIRVDPDISVEDFRSTFASDLVNKTVVFYCSVGRRSSELAEKVGEDLMSTGSKQVLNLEHGIFGWHNESRRLMSGEQPTDYVHPYSWRWDDLIARRSLIRYKPE